MTDNKLLFLEKSIKQQYNELKENIIKMLVCRGFINKENEKKSIKNLIDAEMNDEVYTIPLDNDKNYNTEIPNKRIILSFIDYKIMSAAKKTVIGELMFRFYDDYKIILVNGITTRSEAMLDSYKTPYEIFDITTFKQNIVEHKLVPQHQVLSQTEGEDVLKSYNALKKQMPFILEGEPMAKFYAMKVGEVCKIMRPSTMTAESPFYRLVIKGKHVSAK